MATEIRVPTLGESVTEATIGTWFKKVGDTIAADEPLVELETDKVTVEVPAPAAGTLAEISVKEGETVEVGALLGSIAEGQGKAAAPAGKDAPKKEEPKKADAAAKPEEAPAAGATPDSAPATGDAGAANASDAPKPSSDDIEMDLD